MFLSEAIQYSLESLLARKPIMSHREERMTKRGETVHIKCCNIGIDKISFMNYSTLGYELWFNIYLILYLLIARNILANSIVQSLLGISPKNLNLCSWDRFNSVTPSCLESSDLTSLSRLSWYLAEFELLGESFTYIFV